MYYCNSLCINATATVYSEHPWLMLF